MGEAALPVAQGAPDASGAPPASAVPGQLIGRRYRLLDAIGHGGMGVVYRAHDLLDGQVALKRLHAASSSDSGQEKKDESEVSTFSRDRTELIALALAHEFRTLSSLRHGNIISVIDYGFDEQRMPYLTMDLLEEAKSVLEAGRDETLLVQVDLLIQILQALAYLHRRGIIHRDLKPANVLVTQGRVKVLDFGIAVEREQVSRAVRAGTPGYLAPEVLRGEPASERSDLYAVGLIAREWYLARQEHGTASHSSALASTHLVDSLAPSKASRDNEKTATLDEAEDAAGLGSLALPEALRRELAPVVERLLAANPRDRFANADEAIAAVCYATAQPLPEESGSVRESFLQAARFVGREAERQQLGAVLDQAIAGAGSGWLLAGESGVGKSRLLDELRALAQVKGAVVLRGQAVSEGGSPYQAWRPVLRWLAILTELTELEASVLKRIVPDIETLLGRSVPDPVELDVEVAQARLLAVVEDVFARQTQPMVIFLEDLHWAGSETLKLVARLAASNATWPVLLIATFRDDERPDLPSLLPAMQVLKLKRLSGGDVALLTESMMGKAGREPQLVEALVRETEGNPFFLVEVVRELAEEAGRLDRIDQSMRSLSLPRPNVLAQGVRQIVQRKLSRVPQSARPLLTLAAVVGRQVEVALLRALAPNVDMERWLLECANAAVLDVEGGHWRFAHDKLRDGLLREIADAARPDLHRQVALAIEQVYGDQTERVASLAFHWAEAGDVAREAHWTLRAGELALQAGACAEAQRLLDRALTLVSHSLTITQVTLPRDAKPIATGPLGDLGKAARAEARQRQLLLGHIEALLAETEFQLGDIDQCRVHGERAIDHYGKNMPRSKPGWVGGTLREVGVRVLQTLEPSLFVENEPEERAARLEAGRLLTRLTDVFIYQQEALPILWSGLRTLNLCDPAGPSGELARGYASMAVVIGTMPFHGIMESWCKRAIEIARQAGNPTDIAFVLTRNGVCSAYLGRWAEVEAWALEAMEIVDGLGDFRLAEDCRSLLALALHYQGQFDRCLPLWSWIEASGRRRGALQMEILGPLGLGASILRMGRGADAIAFIETALPKLKQQGGGFDVNVYGSLALAHLRQGDVGKARIAANKVLANIATARPVAHFTHLGITMLVDACLGLWEQGKDGPDAVELAKASRDAAKGMRNFAKIFPFGVPFALLSEGSVAYLAGKPKRAFETWQRCLEEATRLSMRYEQGRAHLQIGRHLEVGDPERQGHLAEAARIFEDLIAIDDLDLARAELKR